MSFVILLVVFRVVRDENLSSTCPPFVSHLSIVYRSPFANCTAHASRGTPLRESKGIFNQQHICIQTVFSDEGANAWKRALLR